MKTYLQIAVFAMTVTMAMVAFPCTNILVTREATVDGSTLVSYSADSHVLYGELYYQPASKNIPGTKRNIYEWDTGKYLGQIDEVEETYAVVGNMNEHQVTIGETTWGGREELYKEKHPEDVLDYGSLMYVTLQRAKTAREAVEMMGKLVEKWGYASEGESFSIADPKEVWFMDLIGKGKEKGAVWVARKLPSGYVSAHANQARIRQFPLKDKDTLYSKDVISFARKMGYFNGEDRLFSFADAYAPMTFTAIRCCEARVWSVFRRIAPSINFSEDYVNGVPDAKPLPLWIKPDKKLSQRDVMELMRDHFEGTSLDLSKDLGAGPFKLPYRWRPLTWEYNKVKYFNERAISTQQTGFSFVAQARSWLPDPIGGIIWFSVDDTYTTVYVPMYCGIKEVPYNFAVGTGSFKEFSWDSAFWIFNWVANSAYSRYSDMVKDIQIVQRELEGYFIAKLPEVDAAAQQLYKKSLDEARTYLTNYSKEQSKQTVDRWRKLGIELLYKYLDGNVKDSNGNVTHVPYSEEWRKAIVDDTGDHFKIKKLPGEPEEGH